MGSTSTSTTTLRALSNLISASVGEIERHCESSKLAFPSLDEPFTVESEAVRNDPTIAKATSIVVAAASQLITTLQQPVNTFVNMACGYHLCAALQTVLVTNTAECLREGGPQGLHVEDIAAKVDVDSKKLARILRFLATYHVFREVAPDVFTNNRLSSMLDTGKSLEGLKASPLEKHEGTPGVAALLEHFTDEVFKSSAYMTDTLLDPKFGHSTAPTQTPFNKAFHTDLDIFTWFELPENKRRLRRFGPAMNAPEKVNPTDRILKDFDWSSLKKGSLVVDVGGGIGNTTLALYRSYPELRFVVQDRPPVVEQGIKFWTEAAPDALKSGTVTLQAHDFLQPQPIKDASVFLLRMVTHDWSDHISEQILRHLRAAATPATLLLLVDNIIPYACADTNNYEGVPGATVPLPPAPLLANMGQANSLAYLTDLQMLAIFNAQERTIGQFDALFEKSGWKLSRIHRSQDFSLQKIVAIPK